MAVDSVSSGQKRGLGKTLETSFWWKPIKLIQRQKVEKQFTRKSALFCEHAQQKHERTRFADEGMSERKVSGKG